MLGSIVMLSMNLSGHPSINNKILTYLLHNSSGYMKHAYFEINGIFQGFSYQKTCVYFKFILVAMTSNFSYQYYFLQLWFEENSNKNPRRIITQSCHMTYQLKVYSIDLMLANQSQSWIQNLALWLALSIKFAEKVWSRLVMCQVWYTARFLNKNCLEKSQAGNINHLAYQVCSSFT